MIEKYQTAIYLMGLLNKTFTGDWYCENINEDIESWVFTDGERRQKPVPRDAFKLLTQDNLMFKSQRPWSEIMAERVRTNSSILIDGLEAELDKAMLEPFGDKP